MASKVNLVFDNQMHGISTGSHGSSQIGPTEGALAPYEMVLGGLGGCLNSTFQDVLDKRRINIHGVNYVIEGEKRDEVPKWLKQVHVDVSVSGVDEDDKKKVEKSFETATRYCSVYQTLSHVATMTYTLTFKSENE